MKRVWDVLMLTLALNFLAMGGVVAWLYQGGHLDRERVGKIKEVLFPPPPAPAAPTTQPTSDTDPAVRPAIQLDELLAKHANLTAGQQVDFVRLTFDAQMAQLDRRSRELADLKAQIDLANAKLATDRTALEADRKKLTDDQEKSKKLATDQGFQDSLNLYNSMPAKQVKGIFVSLSDDAMLQYLQAMEPRTAGKIMKEFKTPEETERIQRIMEMMRKGPPTTQEAKG
jgi:flagellar motility protein MotE (MotC chaperone)